MSAVPVSRLASSLSSSEPEMHAATLHRHAHWANANWVPMRQLSHCPFWIWYHEQGGVRAVVNKNLRRELKRKVASSTCLFLVLDHEARRCHRRREAVQHLHGQTEFRAVLFAQPAAAREGAVAAGVPAHVTVQHAFSARTEAGV